MNQYFIPSALCAVLIFGASVSGKPLAGVSPGEAAPQDSIAQAQLDSILIAGADSLELLQGVEVVAARKLVTSDGATLTYNVTEDPEAAGSGLLDILRKVPGVTVDAEENVKVNGQSSFKILMNGREDPMLKGSDLKSVLKSIPAATIKKIEVISEPGAKYEAEGVGGILNIVTESTSRISGMVMDMSGWVSSYSAGASVSGRSKLDKVMLGASVSYNNSHPFGRYSSSRSETEYLDGGPYKLERSHSKQKSGWDYLSARANMSWEPDTLNLFTASAFYYRNAYKSKSFGMRTMFARGYDPESPDPSQWIVWDLERSSHSGDLSNSAGGEVSYQHSFGRPDNNIVASYLFDYSYNNDFTSFSIDRFSGELTDLPYKKNLSKNHSTTHVVQLDYSNRFTKKHQLEAGAKVNIDNSRQNSSLLGGDDAASAVVDAAQTVDVGQFKDIYALYGSYSGSFGKLGVKGGLRYEYTRTGLRYHSGDYDDFTASLSDLVPNAAVSYNFRPASTLRAAYQMRISRPGIGVLNPYVNTLTPGQIFYGNPDLKSQKGHNVSLSYSNYENALTGSAKVSYSYVANGITDVIFMKDNVLNSTYANIGKFRRVEMQLNIDWSGVKDFRLSLWQSVSYLHMKAESELLTAKNHGWQSYTSLSADYKLPCKLRLSAYGGYYTPWLDIQSKGSSGYYYGFGASRSFLKDDALTLRIGCGDILPASRRHHYSQESETVRMSSTFVSKQWSVNFGISWRFGGLKADVKRTAASVEKEESSSAPSH